MIVDRLHFSGAWIEMLWRYACLIASRVRCNKMADWEGLALRPPLDPLSLLSPCEIRKVTVYNGRHREPGYGVDIFELHFTVSREGDSLYLIGPCPSAHCALSSSPSAGYCRCCRWPAPSFRPIRYSESLSRAYRSRNASLCST